MALAAGPAQQQELPYPLPLAEDGRHLAVYLVTFGPGSQIWERFGHNAILIRDTVTSESTAYDYGRFSFEQKQFFIGFARGRMQYWMGRDDGVALINAYIRRQRSAWMQQLALSPAQRIRLRSPAGAGARLASRRSRSGRSRPPGHPRPGSRTRRAAP